MQRTTLHAANQPGYRIGREKTAIGAGFHGTATRCFIGKGSVSLEYLTECQPPVGSPPGDTGDYPPIELTGSLHGCWYTYMSSSCLNGATCGTFETTYTFTAKYLDDTFAEEIHGRCHHQIVGGTGGFAGVAGLILFKDDVVNLKFDQRGHITLE